jgi:hypothetical protein
MRGAPFVKIWDSRSASMSRAARLGSLGQIQAEQLVRNAALVTEFEIQ